MQIDWAEGKWEILECCGCHEVSLRETWINSEDIDENGPYPHVTYYPPRGLGKRPLRRFEHTSWELRNIYKETIEAFNHDLYILAAAGVRALVEAVCGELGVESGQIPVCDKDGNPRKDATGAPVTRRSDRLEGKINGLAAEGHLSPKHARMLHAHRFLGNDAVHSLGSPSAEQLSAAIEVVEHTLENVFELPKRATKVSPRWRPSGEGG